MKSHVKPIPKGYHTVTPYLIVHNAAEALGFYARALGATELCRIPGPGGRVMHAEIKVGDSHIMLADENAGMRVRSPKALTGTTISLMLYVEDVDALFTQAVRAGAVAVRPVQDMFYGDRSGTLADPYGHIWEVATHKEDVSPEELQHRMMAATS
jgi:PhnB protein